MTVYQALDGALRFPAALPERLGLALAQAPEADPGLADRLRAAKAGADPATATVEQAGLARLLRMAEPAGQGHGPQGRPADAAEPAPGVWLQVAAGPQGARYVLSGPGLDETFGTRLAGWLAGQG